TIRLLETVMSPKKREDLTMETIKSRFCCKRPLLQTPIKSKLVPELLKLMIWFMIDHLWSTSSFLFWLSGFFILYVPIMIAEENKKIPVNNP
ncbi:hypothetical protein, partial [Ileibacterium valens]|uniref:hypothetical protein n=2 Tax=Ileibacterium valens TaxID=1862668 RepID=UPI00257105BB